MTPEEHTTPQEHTVASYRDAVLTLVRPLGVERVRLEDALGRVVAAPVGARRPIPGFDNAAMDGFAVRAEDVEGSTAERPARLTVIAHARAGSRAEPPVLGRGEAVRIMTGAPVPEGADAVVPVELSAAGRFVDEPEVTLWAAGKANIRRAGEDVEAGRLLLEAASVLDARSLALLAATGHADVVVHRRPRVAIVSSGDELAEGAGSSRWSGAIPDSNAVYLRAAVESLGGTVTGVHRATDDEVSLVLALDAASRGADLILSSGGVGAGTHDLIGRAAAESPGGMLARVAMRPGRPQAHGTWNRVPWLALPGTPTAAFVSFEAFARPAIDRLAGRSAGSSGMAVETVSEGWSGTAGSVRYVPLAVTDRADGLLVRPLGRPGHASHDLSAMFLAPLIGVVGSQTGDVAPGQALSVIQPT